MRILSFEATNLGRHSHIAADLDDPVVGVLGENGKGKSTVLNGLKYALTGIAPDDKTAHDFVRDGGAHGTMEVMVRFAVRGTIGSITRRVTKSGSASRKLTWEGKEYAAAKEVDAIMADLLGADKRAAVNCVFIPQGDITDVVMGPDTKRELAFQRMLGCAHFSTIAAAAQRQAQLLRSNVTDLSGQISTLNDQLGSVLHEVSVNQDKQAELPNLQGLQSNLQEIVQQLDVIKQHSNCMKLIQDLQARREGIRWPADVLNLQQAQAALEACRMTSQTMHEAILRSSKEQTSLEELVQLHNQMQQAWSRWAQAETAYLGSQPVDDTALAHLQQSLAEARNQEEQLTARRKAHQGWTALVQQEAALTAQQQQLDKALLAAQEEERQLKDKLEYASSNPELELLKLTRTLCLAVLHHPAGDGHQCPLCKSQVAWSKEEQQKHFDTATARLAQLEQQVEEARTSWQTASLHLSRTTKQLQDINTQLTRCTTARQAAEAAQAHHPVADTCMTQMITELSTRIEDLKRQQKQHVALKSEYDQAKALWQSWLEHPKGYEHIRACDPRQAELVLLQLGRDLQQYQQTRAAADERSNMLNQLLTQAGTYDQQIAEAWTSKHLLPQPHAAGEEGLLAMQTQVQETIRQVQDLQASARTLGGMVDSVRKQITDLQAEQNKQDRQLRLADDMDTIANIFGREGIVRAYMDDMYGLLLQTCGPHLDKIGANFCVRKDPQNFLSFEFKRTDEESEWMPQRMLSGGQAVRMALAFLLALHQVLIPEVGLLVLDEPTTHLSKAGREGFRDLLEDMRPVLQRTECQVLVCDHCDEVQSSLDKKIILV
jgi:DNA repair exonuclease SbcCD ATPase subunit